MRYVRLEWVCLGFFEGCDNADSSVGLWWYMVKGASLSSTPKKTKIAKMKAGVPTFTRLSTFRCD